MFEEKAQEAGQESRDEAAPPAVEEQPPVESSANLDAIFGGSEPPEETVPEEQSPAVEEQPADLGAMFGGGESAEVNLDSVFDKGEAEQPAREEAEIPDSAADLGAIFGGESQVGQPAADEAAAQAIEQNQKEEALPEEENEEASQSEGTVAKETVEQEVQSESTDEAVSAETQAPSGTAGEAADLNAMFGEEAVEKVRETDKPDMTAVQDKQTETQEVSTDEKSEEPPAEIVVEVPVVPEDREEELEEKLEETQEKLEEKTETEHVEESAADDAAAIYTLLPGNDSALCVLKLETGSVRVIRGLLAAMDGSLSLDGEVLTGSGLAWMGQGNLTPVVVRYTEGMTVRIDRVAVRPVGLTRETCGIGSVPSLCKFRGKGNNILVFVSGRTKKLSVSPGLKVRGGSVVASDPGVVFKEDGSEFLSVSGEGMLIITG